MVLDFLKSSYSKLKLALSQTADRLGNKIRALFNKKIDEKTLDSLEELFYEADLGVTLSTTLTEKIQSRHQQISFKNAEEILHFIQKELILEITPPKSENSSEALPQVILIVGVNGSGKTTSCAKLAHLFKKEGQTVLLAAADTFRAAAIDQLTLWSEKVQIPIVKGMPGSDPSSVAFDAITAAKARKIETVIIDTAGRLHTKTSLMQELEKIRRTCQKVMPGSPHEIFLVLDASLGQNALDQAKKFHAATPLTGIILTKIDGTAKGGIAISIQKELQVPIRYLGIGEQMNDLQLFDLEEFVHALFN